MEAAPENTRLSEGGGEKAPTPQSLTAEAAGSRDALAGGAGGTNPLAADLPLGLAVPSAAAERRNFPAASASSGLVPLSALFPPDLPAAGSQAESVPAAAGGLHVPPAAAAGEPKPVSAAGGGSHIPLATDAGPKPVSAAVAGDSHIPPAAAASPRPVWAATGGPHISPATGPRPISATAAATGLAAAGGSHIPPPVTVGLRGIGRRLVVKGPTPAPPLSTNAPVASGSRSSGGLPKVPSREVPMRLALDPSPETPETPPQAGGSDPLAVPSEPGKRGVLEEGASTKTPSQRKRPRGGIDVKEAPSEARPAAKKLLLCAVRALCRFRGSEAKIAGFLFP